MKGYNSYKSPWILVIFLIVGAIIGTIIGEALGAVPSLAILKEAKTIGIPTTSLDLYVFTLTFGLLLKLNLVGVVGLLLGILAYRRV
jgi:hypothetical protein